MNKWAFFWAIWACAVFSALGSYKIESAGDHFVFQDLGEAATGLSYGHLFADLDLKAFVEQQDLLEKYLDNDIRDIVRSQGENSTLVKEWESLRGLVTKARKSVNAATYAFFRRGAGDFISNMREKRSFLGPLGFFTSIVDLGFSIFQEGEIQSLKASARANTKAIHALAEYCHAVDDCVQKNARNIEHIRSALTKVVREITLMKTEVALVELMAAVEMVVVRWEINARIWSNGVLELFQRRLNPTLVHFDNLRHGYEKMVKAAAQFGKRPVYGTMDSLMSSEFSWILQDGRVTIIIHIIFCSPAKLRLLKFANLPHVVHNNTLAFLEAKEDVLALDAKHGMGTLVKSGDLRHCTHKKNIFACDRLGVLRTDISETCLGFAYRGDAVGVANSCKFSFSKATTPYMTQLDDTTVGLTVTKPVVGNFQCADGSVKAKSFESGSYTIVTNCTMIAGSVSFEPSNVLLRMKGNFIRIPTLTKLPNTLKYVLQDTALISSALDDLGKVIAPTKVPYEDVRRAVIQAELLSAATERRVGPILAVVVSLLVCLLIFIAFRGWRWYRQMQKSKKGYENPPRTGDDPPCEEGRTNASGTDFSISRIDSNAGH